MVAPELAELIAFAEELTKDTNEAYEEGVALRKELAALKKAKKRAARLRK